MLPALGWVLQTYISVPEHSFVVAAKALTEVCDVVSVVVAMSTPVLVDGGSSHTMLATLRPTRCAPAPQPPRILTRSYQWLYHHHPGLARVACSHMTHLPRPPQAKEEESQSQAKTYASSQENKVGPAGKGLNMYTVTVRSVSSRDSVGWWEALES